MRRSLLRLVLGLGAALGLALGAYLAWSRLPASTSLEPRCPPPDIPLARDKSLGVNVDLSQYTPVAREEALAAMSAAGFGWLRQRFPWDRIEPLPGVYDWAVWDAIVGDVSRHGIKLIAVLDGSPAWARTEQDAANPLAPPMEARDYGAFVSAFARRYSEQIDHYQLWDEPNIAPHWGDRWVDPPGYMRLLREGAIQARAADPGSVVLLAALAPNVESGGANMSDVKFLEALYQQGAAHWFDVVAAQPYGFDQPLSQPSAPGRLNFARAELLRGVMESHQDLGTAVWGVGFGWTEEQASPRPVAEVVRDAVGRARREWPWMGPMLWAAWSSRDAQGRYALLQQGQQPGAVLGALSAMGAVPSVALPGFHPANDPSGTYQGQWRVTSAGADIGATGDRLVIAFWGTRLDLTVRSGDYRAFLFVSVDGQPANALPKDQDGRAYLVLFDPQGKKSATTLAKHLPEGNHVAEVVAEGGWGQWAIVGWSVCRESVRRFPWLPAGLAACALIVLGVSTYGGWSDRALVRRAYRALADRSRAVDGRLALLLAASAAVAVYALQGTIPSLAALVLLAGFLVLRPDMGLPLIAFALPFWQPGKPLMGKAFSMVEILTWLTAAAWVVNGVLDGWFGVVRRERRTSGVGTLRSWLSNLTALDWGMGALVLLGALSLLWAEHAREAMREFRTVILDAAMFYGLLRLSVRNPKSVWRVADAWVLGSVVIALVALSQWLFGKNLIIAEGVWRVRGFYGSPNNLALYLGRALPLAIAIGLWGRGKRRRWLYGLAAVSMAIAIALTYSRGAWLLGVPASLLLVAAVRGRRTLLPVAGALLLVALLVFLVVGPSRLVSLEDTGQGTAFLRLQLWRSSWDMIRDHPVLGVGLDNFLYFYRSVYVLPTAWEEFNLSHPHNIVLDFWLRLGLPGLAVIGWLLISFFKRCRESVRTLPDSDTRLLILGLMAGMVDFLAHGLVDNAFFLVDLAFVFVLMLALLQSTAGWALQPAAERQAE